MFVIIVRLWPRVAQGADLAPAVIMESRAARNVLAMHSTDPLTLSSDQTESYLVYLPQSCRRLRTRCSMVATQEESTDFCFY